MPNFHENVLVIAASEEDMRKVLGRFAENINANLEARGRGTEAVRTDGAPDLRKLWRRLSPALDVSYDLAFVGGSSMRDAGGADSSAWESPTGSGSAFRSDAAALAGRIMDAAEDAGFDVGIDVMPTGDYLSETADADLCRHGRAWVLVMEYATGWEPNADDLDAFFAGLPAGSYGVAFLDSDEGDGYETASVLSVLLHGGVALFPTSAEGAGVLDLAGMAALARDAAEAHRKDPGDLEALARACGAIKLASIMAEELQVSGDVVAAPDLPSLLPDERPGLAPSGGRPDPSHVVLDRDHFDQIFPSILTMAADLPRADLVYWDSYEGRGSGVERLIPGETLRIVADWERQDCGPVTLEVFRTNGRRIGDLVVIDADWLDAATFIWGNARIALMLPHVHAFAHAVEPSSIRGKAGRPRVSVCLELADGPLAGLAGEVSELLGRLPAKRGVESSLEGPRIQVRAGQAAAADATSDIPEGSWWEDCRDAPKMASRGEGRREDGPKSRLLREADLATLIDAYRAAGGGDALIADDAAGLLPPQVIGIDAISCLELRQVPLTFLEMPYFSLEPLRAGDAFAVALEPGGTGYGGIPLARVIFKRVGGGFGIILTMEDEFRDPGSLREGSPLASFLDPPAEVVAMEEVGGHAVARVRFRYLAGLRKETLLYSLWKMGAVTRKDFAGGDGWCRCLG